VPHFEQKPRSTPSDDEKRDGIPRVHESFVLGVPTSAAKKFPTAFWHMRQWQICALSKSSVVRNLIAPHWHPPVKIMSAISQLSNFRGRFSTSFQFCPAERVAICLTFDNHPILTVTPAFAGMTIGWCLGS
jgi:hypothetical protein